MWKAIKRIRQIPPLSATDRIRIYSIRNADSIQ